MPVWMSFIRIFLVCSFLIYPGLWSAFGQAQTESPAAPRPAENTPPPIIIEPIAPYDDKLLRLSEVLGSVHYLRTLCGAGEGNKWRDIMSGLLDSENPGPKRKARLIAHFNRGFRAFDGTYSVCTSSAQLAASKYVTEGILLSAQITDRYGR